MNYSELKNWVKNHLSIKKRVQRIAVCYLIYLMVSVRKHTLEGAGRLLGVNKSLFSMLLKNHCDLAVYTLNDLSKKQAKQYSKVLENLANNALPWKIAILIDSTLQGRSTRHTQNAKRFNHGQGFVIGHQWTNIILIVNDMIIPLPPIPFHSKIYCKKHKLEYKTEHDLVVERIVALNLCDYIGPHDPKDVIVLADSGYDCIKIEMAIVKKKWNFIIALGKTRSVKTSKKYLTTPKSKDWTQVASFFKNNRYVEWVTIRFFTNGPKKKRMEFRIREIIGYLRYVGEVKLICSEFKKRPDGRRKYLACNDLKATARQILLGYRLRWAIEIFHKDVKQYLGFQDVAVTTFDAVKAHVHWVYCAYILLNMSPPGIPANGSTLREKQQKVTEIVNNRQFSEFRQILSQIGGPEKLMNLLNPVSQTT